MSPGERRAEEIDPSAGRRCGEGSCAIVDQVLVVSLFPRRTGPEEGGAAVLVCGPGNRPASSRRFTGRPGASAAASGTLAVTEPSARSRAFFFVGNGVVAFARSFTNPERWCEYCCCVGLIRSLVHHRIYL